MSRRDGAAVIGHIVGLSVPPFLAVLSYSPLAWAILRSSSNQPLWRRLAAQTPIVLSIMGIPGYWTAILETVTNRPPKSPALFISLSLWIALLASVIGTVLSIVSLIPFFVPPPIASIINSIALLRARRKAKMGQRGGLKVAWVATGILMSLTVLMAIVWYSEFRQIPWLG